MKDKWINKDGETALSIKPFVLGYKALMGNKYWCWCQIPSMQANCALFSGMVMGDENRCKEFLLSELKKLCSKTINELERSFNA